MKQNIMKQFADYYHFVFLFLFFIMQIYLHKNIYLYGDDFYYGSFFKLDFWQLHIDHYLSVNGRALIHFLASLILYFDIFLFRIINPFLIIILIYFLSKLVASNHSSNNKETFKKLITFSIMLFCLIDIEVSNGSIYWATGSMNYLLPITLNVMLIYFVQKSVTNNKFSYFTFFLIFIASITTEQSCMVSFGFIILIVLFNYFSKNTIPKFAYSYILISFIGLLLVVLAPGNFSRMSVYGNTDYFYNIIYVAVLIFYKKNFIFFHTVLALTILFNIENIFSRADIRKYIKIMLVFYIFTALFRNVYTSDSTIFTIMLFIATTLYLFSIITVLYFLFKEKKYHISIIAFILAVGSQLMLIPIAAVCGTRNNLIAIILIFILILSLASNVFNKKYYIPCIGIIIAIFYGGYTLLTIAIFSLIYNILIKNNIYQIIMKNLIIFVCTIFLMTSYINSYKTVSALHEYNNKQVERYKTDITLQESLVINLKSITSDESNYQWSPLIESPYHQYWYKVYNGLPEETEIIFVE